MIGWNDLVENMITELQASSFGMNVFYDVWNHCGSETVVRPNVLTFS